MRHTEIARRTINAIRQHLDDRRELGMPPVYDMKRFFMFAEEALGCDMPTMLAACRAGVFIMTDDGMMVIR